MGTKQVAARAMISDAYLAMGILSLAMASLVLFGPEKLRQGLLVLLWLSILVMNITMLIALLRHEKTNNPIAGFLAWSANTTVAAGMIWGVVVQSPDHYSGIGAAFGLVTGLITGVLIMRTQPWQMLGLTSLLWQSLCGTVAWQTVFNSQQLWATNKGYYGLFVVIFIGSYGLVQALALGMGALTLNLSTAPKRKYITCDCCGRDVFPILVSGKVHCPVCGQETKP